MTRGCNAWVWLSGVRPYRWVLTGVDMDSFGMAESQCLLQGNKVHVVSRVDGEWSAKYVVCD